MTRAVKRIAIVVGGGPAPGINGVISSATIAAIRQNLVVYGFMDGFKWLIDERSTGDGWLKRNGHVKRLEIGEVHEVRDEEGFQYLPNIKNVQLQGGSVLRTSRANPTKSSEAMGRTLRVLKDMAVDVLITIGGDDTAFSGKELQKFAKKEGHSLVVVHVPKTIDNDLPLPDSMPTFGFETARHVGTTIVRNLAVDARTTSRWYIAVSMGRAAGHLALGIGTAAAATLTLIPEEFNGREVTLELICDIILGSIIKRKVHDRHHGVVVLAEGLLESIGAEGLQRELGKDLEKYGSLEKDEHGHLRLGEIDFGRMIKDRLKSELKELAPRSQVDLKIGFVDNEIGYELRSAAPIPFDAEYTRNLGYGAIKYLLSGEQKDDGVVIAFSQGRMKPVPFRAITNPDTGRMFNRKVAVDGEAFECSLRYMIRLEKSDFDNAEELDRLAAAAGMTADEFRSRFARTVFHPPSK